MNITEAICTGNRRYRAAEKFAPRGVVLHSIGTPQPKAEVLRDYWQRDASAYVVHYMVDDRTILHCMPDSYKCWHVGSPGNGQWLGIEMGEPSQIKYTGGASFTVSDLAEAQAYAEAAYKNAVWLIAQLCKKYGWDPFTAVYTHREVTRQKLSNTDHVDPQHLWDGLGMGYDLARLRRDVAAAMGQGTAAPAPEVPSTPSTPASGQIYRIRKFWGDAASQVGAYTNLEYAKAACPNGYTVYDGSGNVVFSRSEETGAYTLAQFIRDVQSTCGAAVDGIAGPETLAKTVTISATKNSRHAAVKPVQRRLLALGYTQAGTADGIAGPKFTAALKAFQTNNGCVADGEATAQKKTWKKLLGMA